MKNSPSDALIKALDSIPITRSFAEEDPKDLPQVIWMDNIKESPSNINAYQEFIIQVFGFDLGSVSKMLLIDLESNSIEINVSKEPTPMAIKMDMSNELFIIFDPTSPHFQNFYNSFSITKDTAVNTTGQKGGCQEDIGHAQAKTPSSLVENSSRPSGMYREGIQLPNKGPSWHDTTCGMFSDRRSSDRYLLSTDVYSWPAIATPNEPQICQEQEQWLLFDAYLRNKVKNLSGSQGFEFQIHDLAGQKFKCILYKEQLKGDTPFTVFNFDEQEHYLVYIDQNTSLQSSIESSCEIWDPKNFAGMNP